MMKKIGTLVLVVSALVFSVSVNAQSTTFEVEKIDMPKVGLPKKDENQIIEQLKVKSEKTSFPNQKLIYFSKHNFFEGVLTAYRKHYPMTFSPDAIWQVINMGFSRHVGANAESLRKKFVDFKGKKKIIVIVDENEIELANRNSNWEIVFPQFTKEIGKFTGEKLIKNLTGDFSTSTPTTIIASQITIMDAMEHYFDYEVGVGGCGVSRVTLEGTVKDWENLLKKTKFLAQFDLDWWTNELIPILEQFIAAKKGKVDKKFWKNMVRIKEGKGGAYGTPTKIDGWINKFYPYDANDLRRNFSPIVDPESQLATDWVEVPFVLSFFKTKTTYDMQFQAGFVGWSQDSVTLSMRPEVGWLVNHAPIKVGLGLTDPHKRWGEARKKTKIAGLSRENIVELEAAIFTLFEEIIFLDLSFKDEVFFDERLADIKIKRLTLKGKISPEVEAKYRNLKNVAELVINP